MAREEVPPITAAPISPNNEPNEDAARPTLLRRVGWFLVGSVIFGLAYTQVPLYFSNQNQYFLHGLARAGRGYLYEDWLANTRDPTLAFSAMVAFVGGSLHEYVFYGLYVLLLGAYFHSLMGIAERVFFREPSRRSRLLLATMFVVVHAGVVRFMFVRFAGGDLPWFAQSGVADQYVLGPGLQPSTFGVLLLVSLHSFLRGHPLRAATWACLGAILHATYLLGAGLLVFSYILLLLRDGRVRQAMLIGAWALLLVSPVIIYSFVMFHPSDSQKFAEAQRILAHIRIPHHAEPKRWFDAIAFAQIAWIVAAILLAWRSRLFVILATVFTLSALLTVVELISASDSLALLFPWRTSALLMPLATTIILARLVVVAEPKFRRWSNAKLRVACGSLLCLCVTGGLAIGAKCWGYHTIPQAFPLLEYVQTHKQPGEVYLLPIEAPSAIPAPTRPASRPEKRAPISRRGSSVPPMLVDLQTFRLATGAPIYVDFKSIPYQDVEVLEWYRRLQWAGRIYAMPDWSDPAIIRELIEHGITHVVTTSDRVVNNPALTMVYEDAAYRLYCVERPG